MSTTMPTAGDTALAQNRGARPATTRTYRVAAIPGDGIGREVLPAALRVLDVAADRAGFTLELDHLDWSCERYLTAGAMMPTDGLEQVGGHDALLLGAVGAPEVPDHVSLWGLLVPIRRSFRLYANVRPARSLTGVPTPVEVDPARPVDLVVVRENVEGEYSQIGGRLNGGFPDEMAVQEAIFTRAGVERIARHAFALAEQRRGKLVSATKSNGIVHTMPFWDEVVAEQSEQHPGVTWRSEHLDALAAKLVLDPAAFDVIVASNLFGDVLSDLTAALVGGLGLAASANLDPTRRHPSLFEPVHGSAPDIAGQGVANPVGAIWAASLMLDHLGEVDAARRVLGAVEGVLARTDVRTPDLGGDATTERFTESVITALTEETTS
jgi:tartrate dehydrogenase/decarboxylase / D-malate dehydrogenase